MASWFGSIWHGLATTIVGLLAIVGIGHSDITAVNTATNVESGGSIQVVANINDESGSSTLSAIDELRAELEQEKAARLKLQEQIISKTSSTASPKATSASSNSSSKSFTTPSGAVVDTVGNVISSPPTNNSQATVIAGQGKLTTKDIASLLSPSVALISTPGGKGSGVVIENGKYILTNEHVVGDYTFVTISLPSLGAFSAPVLGKDSLIDLAIVYVGDHKPPAGKLGSSSTNSMSIGDDVFALGFPFSASVGLTNLTLTKGVLSSRQTVGGQTFLQTDASINPGNSGGPLVNDSGEIIGINVSKLNDVFNAEGIGFAIPIDTAKNYIPSLSQNGQSRYELYPVGSTLTINRSVLLRMTLNDAMSCSLLGFTGQDLKMCDFYRTYPNEYKWDIKDDF